LINSTPLPLGRPRSTNITSTASLQERQPGGQIIGCRHQRHVTGSSDRAGERSAEAGSSSTMASLIGIGEWQAKMWR
jgi:hypothetical protein